MSLTPSGGPTSRVFFSQRLRLHYVDWGNPDAPALLLLHGGRDHCRNWDWVAEALRSEWHIIAPDLRGHGDSAWSQAGNYTMAAFIYDLDQLIHQQRLARATIVAHSLGGNIALRYGGIYPENVRKLVAIEGLGPSPRRIAEHAEHGIAGRMRHWVDEQRGLSGRLPRRYPSIEAALARMQEENRHLSPAQARHLTQHGVNQNEDGTYSWKFDNYVRVSPPYDMTNAEVTSFGPGSHAPRCWSTARKAGRRTRKRTDGSGIFPPPAWSPSKVRATGSITTNSTFFSLNCAHFCKAGRLRPAPCDRTQRVD